MSADDDAGVKYPSAATTVVGNAANTNHAKRHLDRVIDFLTLSSWAWWFGVAVETR